MKSALVVGGGYAGISAALSLAGEGVAVTLLEARQAWGGRATSWRDPKMGDPIDNGQHVWLGCYDATYELLGWLGTQDLVPLTRGLDLSFLEPGGRKHRLLAPPSLGRAGLALALLGYGALPLLARLRLARALRSAPPPGESETAEQWLRRAGQGAAERRAFWDPIVEASLNLPLEDASATLLFTVVCEAFRGPARAACVGLPRVGLAELLAPIADRLAARGGRAVLGAGARRVYATGDGGHGVVLESGDRLEADGLVLAVPAADARALLLTDLPDVADRLTDAASIPTVPIVSVTLWYDVPVVPARMVGLLAPPGGRAPEFQWVFHRPHMVEGGAGAFPLTLVASVATELVTLPAAAVLARAQATLARYGLAQRAPIAGRVVKEPRATPAFDPVGARFRPGPAAGRPGLAFAGDWTATGLPATIEGAVRSGRAAARHLVGSAILPSHARPGEEGSAA
jgi:squalene-associated FAD-dependent desaturase